MKSKIKFRSIILVMFCNSLAFAQFNTLTRTSTKKEESIQKKDEIQKDENAKDEKKQNNNGRIKLFKTRQKVDYKAEIDSLKTLILKYSLSKNKEHKLNYQKIEDSLIQIIKGNIVNANGNNIQKSIKQFDFINDNQTNEISKIFMPLKNGLSVTSPFGTRIHPIFGTRKSHSGADFKANYEKVYSIMDGIVTDAGWDSKGGGNYIKIRHSNSFVTSYLHLSQIYYKAGEFVKAGFIIAKSGNSGNSTGPHLHFSVTENGNYINPIRFLNDLIKTNNLIANYYEH